MARSLDRLVTDVATQLMATTTSQAAEVSQQILAELVEHFDVDASFLRHNDHEQRVTKLVAEWPTRQDVPDPDPLGVISFENADPVFALLEHAKEPIILRPDPITDEYGQRIERAKGIPVFSLAAAPLLSDKSTTGALGFIKFDDREWTPPELNAVVTIAALFAQLQAHILAENRLRHLANYDDLTDLFNRRALIAHLDARLEAGEPGPVTALFLDLDRLKISNDYLGHPYGDKFLKAFAERLRSEAGDSCVIGRLGGDEFVVIPHEPMHEEYAEAWAEELRLGVIESGAVGGEKIRRSISVGVAVGTPGRDTTSDLLRRADEAVRAAKKSGGNQTAVFSLDMSQRSALRTDVELHLRSGIENDALMLEYQPEVDLRTGVVLAVEALVRWNHPTRGRLSPDSFIGVAESINLAGELGRWVLRKACSEYAGWRSRGIGEGVVIRVNVSPIQVVSADFAATVSSILDEFGVDPGSLCLEITESVVVNDIETTKKNLTELRNLGVKVAIDDFGTGYSVLSHLKTLPVDTVKIDKGFVRDLGVNDEDSAIVRAIVGLAAAFGLDVVAEGVESEAAASDLLRYGCHRAQGFLLSRPLAGDATEALLSRGQITNGFTASTSPLVRVNGSPPPQETPHH